MEPRSPCCLGRTSQIECFGGSRSRCRRRIKRRRSGPSPPGGTEEKSERIRGVSPIPLPGLARSLSA